MIRQGVSIAGGGYPGRIDGVTLATNGFVMPGVPAEYPLRVALSVSHRGASLSQTYRGVTVGVIE